EAEERPRDGPHDHHPGGDREGPHGAGEPRGGARPSLEHGLATLVVGSLLHDRILERTIAAGARRAKFGPCPRWWWPAACRWTIRARTGWSAPSWTSWSRPSSPGWW